MTKFTITISDESTTKLDALCAESGYSRSEQIEGMILAECSGCDAMQSADGDREVVELREWAA